MKVLGFVCETRSWIYALTYVVGSLKMDNRTICFGEYKVHPTQGLSRDGLSLHVTPKSLAVLWELVQHPLEVITKEELFRRVWPKSIVTDAALSSCIRELRKALNDNARDPRFIETVHRVGFRFLQSAAADGNVVVGFQAKILAQTRFGQEEELNKLLRLCDRAENGQFQFVLIQGFPAGKILTRRLIELIERKKTWAVGVGSACRIAGTKTAYQPVIHVIRSLCLNSGGIQNVADLRRLAPSCLAELSDLVDSDELRELRKRTAGITTQRWQEDLRRYFNSVCDRHPLLFVLEDLQWADEYTLSWMKSVLGQYRGKMVVVATLASKDFSDTQPRMASWVDLVGHGRGQCVQVQRMDIPSVNDCGHPSLSANDLQVLEQVSTVGYPCHAGLVAAGLDITTSEAESLLVRLEQCGYLSCDLRRVNGKVSDSIATYSLLLSEEDYGYHHRLTLSERNQIHRLVAHYIKREEGEEVAPLVATHFDMGFEPIDAMYWYLKSANVNARRGAHRLAQQNLEEGRSRLEMLSGQDRLEWDARLALAAARTSVALAGIGAPKTEELYRHVSEVQQKLEPQLLQFDILWELWVYYFNRGPLAEAAAIVDQLAGLAKLLGSPELDLAVVHARWCIALMRGDLSTVQTCTQRGMEACGRADYTGTAMTRGCTQSDAHLTNHCAAVCAGFFRGWADGLMGRMDEAKVALDAAITHARDVGHAYSLDVALVMSAAALAAAGEPNTTRRYAEEANLLSVEHGFTVLDGWSRVYLGWAQASLGNVESGLATIGEGLAVCGGTPLWLFRPFQLTLYSELLLSSGLNIEAHAALEEAFQIAERTGDRLAWAEMHRLRGELRVAISPSESAQIQARQDIQIALDFAAYQKADLLAERARASLCGL